MTIVIYEDSLYDQFFPLTYVRPVFELKCGTSSLLEKITQAYPEHTFVLWTRSYLVKALKHRHPDVAINDTKAVAGDDTLWINGRTWFNSALTLPAEGEDEVGLVGDEVVYFRLKKATSATLNIAEQQGDAFGEVIQKIVAQIPQRNIEATVFAYPWELVNTNADILRDDFAQAGKSGIHGEVHERCTFIGEPDQIHVAAGAKIHPNAVLDATDGPINIEEGVIVHPFVRLEGPVHIGRDTYLMAGAHVREGSTVGPVCRIGGEVEESILHGYSNKYHDGFLGHAYLCEWVNLGALTTNSDLRNDYGPVRIFCKGEIITTNSNKVGCFIGDHTKTSIGTLFNTGTICGVMNNIICSGGLMPRIIPSFVMMTGRSASEGKGVEWLIQTARTAMGRRGVTFHEEDEILLRYIYKLTQKERNDTIVRS